MIVTPLVFASIIRGLAATEGLEQLRKMGLRVVLFFVATTVMDRWVEAKASHKDELMEEALHHEIREKTDIDVLTPENVGNSQTSS